MSFASFKKTPAPQLTKTAVCAAAFLIASAFFFSLCRGIAYNYLIPFLPGAGSWWLRVIIAFIFFAIMAGAMTMLVRPFWLSLAVYFVSAVAYLLMTGLSGANAATAGIFFVFLSLYGFSSVKQLKNQVNFSIRPFADKKLLLASLAALLVGVSFWLGYARDAEKRAYVIAPEIKTAMADAVSAQMKILINQEKISPAQKTQALKMSRQKVMKGIDDTEKSLAPYKHIMSALSGVTMFLTLQFVFYVLGFVVLPLLALLLFVLRKTHFVRETNEKIEAVRLTL